MLSSQSAVSSLCFKSTVLFLRNKPKPLPDDVHLGHLLFVLEFELVQFSHCLQIQQKRGKENIGHLLL